MKVTLIAFNEFNKELLEKAAEIYNLNHIKKILSFHHTTTLTEDSYESDFLEPWVQWVNIQTMLPSKKHHVKHLGDSPDHTIAQLWEICSMKGFSSMIWGAMNARRNNTQNNLVFLPDPWTKQEMAYPDELNALLNPLRAVSTNYLKPNLKEVFKYLKTLKKLLVDQDIWIEVKEMIKQLLKDLIAFKGAHFVFIAFAEKLSVKLFLHYKTKLNPDFSIVFINTLAHVQHHHWKGFDYKKNKKLEKALIELDAMFGEIFDSLKEDETCIVANALSQKNTNEEEAWILYRPYSHKTFLNVCGIFPEAIHEHMTHDAHLFFKTPHACKHAFNILDKITVKGDKLFLVQSYEKEPCKLFYRLIFTQELEKQASVIVDKKRLRFFKYYKKIVKRTGKHTQEGSLYCNQLIFKDLIYNHEIGEYILKHLEKTKMQDESFFSQLMT